MHKQPLHEKSNVLFFSLSRILSTRNRAPGMLHSTFQHQCAWLTLGAVILFQILVKNKTIGMILGCVFFLLNLYLVFALLDELAEFASANQALQLALGGATVIGLNLTFSVLMVRKYLTENKSEGTVAD